MYDVQNNAVMFGKSTSCNPLQCFCMKLTVATKTNTLLQLLSSNTTLFAIRCANWKHNYTTLPHIKHKFIKMERGHYKEMRYIFL